jgi:hypothetical protein
LRAVSTPASVARGEVSLLAIAECLAFTAIYLGIGLYFGTFRHLAWAVVVAPFMLLRTTEAAEWGLVVYRRFFRTFAGWIEWWEGGGILSTVVTVILSMLLFLIGPAVGLLIRVTSTAYGAVLRPLPTLREMPRNWVRQALCTDVRQPPEIVPLETRVDSEGDDPDVITFRLLLRLVWTNRMGRLPSVLVLVFNLMTAAPFLVLGYLPSLAYRVSFKATSLIYLPFLWVANTPLQRRDNPLKLRLERIVKGHLEATIRKISLAVLVAIGAKLATLLGWADLGALIGAVSNEKLAALAGSVLNPMGFPWWQVTLGGAAALTFPLYFFGDAALARMEGERPWPAAVVDRAVTFTSLARAALSLATMSYWYVVAMMAMLRI